jgi:hypothetical protein
MKVQEMQLYWYSNISERKCNVWWGMKMEIEIKRNKKTSRQCVDSTQYGWSRGR